MLLGDLDIKKAMKDGRFVCDPAPKKIQPASVDLNLSDRPMLAWMTAKEWRRSTDQVLGFEEGIGQYEIDPFEDQRDKMVTKDDFVLAPGQFALASIAERVEFDSSIAGRLEGKSSLARLGLVVHTTAGFFDPGFRGWPTLELVNHTQHPFRLHAGMSIAQMSLYELRTPAQNGYGRKTLGSKYQDQQAAPQQSRYFENRSQEDRYGRVLRRR